jgi:hypothetical protein
MDAQRPVSLCIFSVLVQSRQDALGCACAAPQLRSRYEVHGNPKDSTTGVVIAFTFDSFSVYSQASRALTNGQCLVYAHHELRHSLS